MALVGHVRGAIGRAGRMLYGSPGRAMWAIAMIGAAMLVVGTMRVVAVNVDAWAQRWRGGAAMVVYLDQSVTEARAENITAQLGALPGVVRAEYVAPTDAASRLRAALGKSAVLLDGVDDASLPASVELTLEAGARDVVVASPLFDALHASDSVEDVELDGEWVDKLATTIAAVRGLCWSLAMLLSVCMALMVVGTLRLAVGTNGLAEGEVLVARLLGAGTTYVALPSLLVGALLGALGSALGLGVLSLLVSHYGPGLAAPITGALGGGAVEFLSTSTVGALLAIGSALGAVCGLIAGTDRAAR